MCLAGIDMEPTDGKAALAADLQAFKAEQSRLVERYEEMYWLLVKIRQTCSLTWQEKHDIETTLKAAEEFVK